MTRRNFRNLKMNQADVLFPETLIQHTTEHETERVELFAGAGGAGLGLARGLGRPITRAVNHNPVALDVYRQNHRTTSTYISDVFEVDPRQTVQNKPVEFLWASPDCTSFSVSKGGKPVNRRLRMLPWSTLPWLAHTRPKWFVAENVCELSTTWGALVARRDKKGQVMYDKNGDMQLVPSRHPRKRNRHWRHFITAIERLGYHVEYRVLNAADYGAATSRKRLFLIASRDTTFIPWPEPSHAHPSNPRVQSGELQPWQTAHDILDYQRPTSSIFERRKPLIETTMRRIAQGVCLHTLRTGNPFLVTCQHSGTAFRGQGVHEPLHTIVAANEARGLVTFRTERGPVDHTTEVYHLLNTHVPADASLNLDHIRQCVTVNGKVIHDIELRMLSTQELKLAQSFPAEYALHEDQHGKPLSIATQVGLIGNSVPPKFSEAIGRALLPFLNLPTTDRPPEWLRHRTEKRAAYQNAAD